MPPRIEYREVGQQSHALSELVINAVFDSHLAIPGNVTSVVFDNQLEDVAVGLVTRTDSMQEKAERARGVYITTDRVLRIDPLDTIGIPIVEDGYELVYEVNLDFAAHVGQQNVLPEVTPRLWGGLIHTHGILYSPLSLEDIAPLLQSPTSAFTPVFTALVTSQRRDIAFRTEQTPYLSKKEIQDIISDLYDNLRPYIREQVSKYTSLVHQMAEEISIRDALLHEFAKKYGLKIFNTFDVTSPLTLDYYHPPQLT